MNDLELELIKLEDQEENLRRVLKRLIVGSKEYTSYSYKLIECRRKITEVKRRLDSK